MARKAVIAADHGGYGLKEVLKQTLKKRRYSVSDAGTCSSEPCDYPEFGFKAAKMVSEGKAQKGVVICKSGIGMSIIANKLPNVRAGLCASVAEAESARKHNDTNVLVLAASKLTAKKAEKILEAWLSTRALRGRHARRVKMIRDKERKLYKKGFLKNEH